MHRVFTVREHARARLVYFLPKTHGNPQMGLILALRK
jgi:hypothetical protein